MEWRWGRRKKSKPAARAPVQAPAENDGSEARGITADRTLDSLAELIRCFGEHSFDTEDRSTDEIRERCDAWAQHLLVGRPPPARAERKREEQSPAADTPVEKKNEPDTMPQRHQVFAADWNGLRSFFTDERSSEASYVTQGFQDLREAIWTFIQGLRRTLKADGSDDDRLRYRLERLERAANHGTHNKLKGEVFDSISEITSLLDGRKERQDGQLSELRERLITIKSELNEARAQAAIDGLTGLNNRSSFDAHLGRVTDYASLFDESMLLILFDVDHFKWVNDTYGHPAGDEVLRRIAAQLTQSFLRRDDFVARYGGEEFAVILRDCDPDATEVICERTLVAIRNIEIEWQQETLRITASAGAAVFASGEKPEEWIERADRALYEAKNGGRDRLAVAAAPGC